MDSLIRAISENAHARPNRVIVKDAIRDWSWCELMSTATRYACELDKVAPRLPRTAIVPLLADRSGHTVAAILGALLSGRAYAPLSSQHPSERIKACYRALDAKAVIVPGSNLGPQDDDGLIRISRLEPVLATELSMPTYFSEPRDFLYVLFTSGSTGVPKGVLVDHSNVLNTVLWGRELLDWHGDDVIGCATNFFFDISQYDLFTSLCLDIPLAIYSNPNDTAQVVRETEQFRITSVFSVPMFFSQLLRNSRVIDACLGSLRRIISGGDFFPPSHILGWMDARPDVEIYNVWGPTETSIVNTMYRVAETDRRLLQADHSVPVGRVHRRMPFVLLDEHGRRVEKPRERGEICMLGACITRGYLNDPEETARSYFQWEGQPAFRTQDLGYLDEEGRLFIIGRMGSTVKIAGYRIDTGEVEKTASSIMGVYLAGAFTVEVQEGIKELWIAVQPLDQDTEFDVFQFKKRLRERLPAYMVPKRVLVYRELPRNANGKVNRKQLVVEAQQTVTKINFNPSISTY